MTDFIFSGLKAAADRFLFAEGKAIERIAYFDPAEVGRALLRNPVGWRQLLRQSTAP